MKKDKSLGNIMVMVMIMLINDNNNNVDDNNQKKVWIIADKTSYLFIEMKQDLLKE